MYSSRDSSPPCNATSRLDVKVASNIRISSFSRSRDKVSDTHSTSSMVPFSSNLIALIVSPIRFRKMM